MIWINLNYNIDNLHIIYYNNYRKTNEGDVIVKLFLREFVVGGNK